MAVPQPQVLLVLNDVSGTTAVNDGTGSGDATITLGVEGVGFSWNTGAGSFDGYWTTFSNAGVNMAQVDMTGAHTYANTLISSYVAFAFAITAFDTSTGYAQIVGGGGGGNGPGDWFNTRINAPAGGGDFDLLLEWKTPNTLVASRTYSALSFSTVYQVVSAVDISDVTSVDAKFKLDSGSILAQTQASGNWTGEVWPTDPGRLNGGAEWDSGGSDTARGVTGNIYYYAGYRGSDAFLADADMDAINANPRAITGWPSAPAGGSFVPMLSQRNRRHTGRYS